MLINLFVTTCFTAAHAGVQNGIFSERANFFFFDQLGGTSARHKHQLARYDSLSFFLYIFRSEQYFFVTVLKHLKTALKMQRRETNRVE